MLSVFRRTFGALVLFTLAACGETSGSVLERIPEHPAGGSNDGGTGMPPDSNLRVDAFIVRDIESCAIGEPCNRNDDPDSRGDGDCFEIEDENGEGFAFRRESLEFVLRSDQEAIDAAEQAHCFHLGIDGDALSSLSDDFSEFRNSVYQLSGGEILLDIRLHEIAEMSAGFVRFENEWSIFLPTDSLQANIPSASRDTDFTFAVTGARDPMTGLAPQVEHCSGTDRDLAEGFAGAGYTWLTTECSGPETLLRHWMFQVAVALRDVNDFNDAYDRNYPPCGEAEEDPARWWPDPDECSVDPDAPTCGENRCEGADDDYVGHVLTAHWPRGRAFVGNHCRNGRVDPRFGETEVDVGGVCELLGR